MTTPLDKIKSAILGNPIDPNKEPSRIGIVQAFAEMQLQLEGSQAGALVKATRSALLALTNAPSAGCMAWVTNDSTVAYNGIYENTGTTSSPTWAKRTDIPQFFITGINTGGGNANALQVTTDLPIPAVDARALIGLQILLTNTASPVNVSINSATPIPIKNSIGSDIEIGALISGSIALGVISQGSFRLITNNPGNFIDAGNLTSGIVPDDRFPERIGGFGDIVADLHNIIKIGKYRANNTTLNTPFAGSWDIEVLGWDSNNLTIFARLPFLDSATNTNTYRKEKNAGIWTSWVKCYETEIELDNRFANGRAITQVVISTSRSLVMEEARGFVLIDTAGITVELPDSSAVGLGGVVRILNGSTGNSSIAYSATDDGTIGSMVIPPKRYVEMFADGINYWRPGAQDHLSFHRTDSSVTTIDPSNARLPILMADGSMRLVAPLTVANTGVPAGVSTFMGRAGSVSLTPADIASIAQQLGVDGNVPTAANGFATSAPGCYFYSGSVNVPAAGNWLIFHDGTASDCVRTALNLANGERWISLDLQTVGPAAWMKIYETETEIASMLEARENTFTPTQNFTGGIKWPKPVGLASGTNLNTVTTGGFYDVELPVNAPWSIPWAYLAVESHYGGANYCKQTLTALNPASGQPSEFCRLRKAGTWLPWKPVSGFASPAMFGATGATTMAGATTDDTTAINRWLDYGLAHPNTPMVLDQFYKITSAISKDISGVNGFGIRGMGAAGRCGFYLAGTTASLAFSGADQSNPSGFDADQYQFTDFLIGIDSDRSQFGIGLSAAPDSGSDAPGLHMRNIHQRCSSNSAGITGALFYMQDIRQFDIQDVSGQGKYFEYQGMMFDINGVENGAPVEGSFTNVRMAHCADVFRLRGSAGSGANDDWQGMHFDRCTGIGVNKLIYASTGPETLGFSEWLTASRCHAYYREAAIYSEKVGNLKVVDCYLLGHGNLSVIQGVGKTGNSIVDPVFISGNTFKFDSSGPTRLSINLPANQVGVCSGNGFQNATGSNYGSCQTPNNYVF